MNLSSSPSLWLFFGALVLSLSLFIPASQDAMASAPEQVQGVSEATQTAQADAPGQMVALFKQLAEELKGTGTNCDRAGQVINKWLERHKELLPTLSQRVDAHLSTLKEKDLMAFEQRLVSSFDVLMRYSTQHCVKHDAFQIAFQQMDSAMGGEGEDVLEQEIDLP